MKTRMNHNYTRACYSRAEEQAAIKRFEAKGWKLGGIQTLINTRKKFRSNLFFHR